MGERAEVGAPRLVGRDADLSRLGNAWRWPHPPALVVVEGEAGVGKTRLLREFFTRPGAPAGVVHTWCPPMRSPFTLGPLVEGLRATGPPIGAELSPLTGALRPLFPDWDAYLPPEPLPMDDPVAARQRLFAAIGEILDRLEIGVLVVEDAHWADDSTLEFLLLTTARRGTCALVTYRREDVPATSPLWRLSRIAAGDTGLRVSLASLTPRATGELVSSMLDDDPVADTLAGFIHEHTEGLPLAVEEVVRALAEQGHLERGLGGWTYTGPADISVPAALRDIVLDRASRLPLEARRVLEAAAVLAEPASEGLLGTVANLSPAAVREGLRAALAARLLEEDQTGRAAFRHELAGRAIDEELTATSRRSLHLRAGQSLARAGAPANRLVPHFRAAGHVHEWCRYAELAADVASASGDETTADRLLLDVICHSELPTSQVARLMGKVRFVEADGSAHYDELLAALRDALTRPGATAYDVAALRCRLGNTLMMLYDFDAGLRELELAVPDLGADTALTAWALTLLGCPFGSRRPAATQLQWLRRADEVVVSEPPTDRADTMNLRGLRTLALLMLGEPEGWDRAALIPEEAAQPGDRLQVARNNLNVGHAAVFWGRYDEAQRRLGVARRLSKRHALRRTGGATEVAIAHLDWFRGAWQGLRTRAEALVDDKEIAPGARREADLVLAHLDSAEGLRDVALTRYLTIVETARDPGQEDVWLESAAAAGNVLLASGDPTGAARLLTEPVTLVAERGIWLWATPLAEPWVRTLVDLERGSEAARFVSAFAAGIEGRGAAAPRAAVTTCRAWLAQASSDLRLAADLFLAASAEWSALPRPYDALACEAARAECLLGSDAADTAVTELESLLQSLWTLGATVDADRVARRLRMLGAHVRRPGAGRPSYGDQLSPREHEVVRLLAAGRTDREIARLLFLSPRTVASHVASARRKLNAPTRTALAVNALAAGITKPADGIHEG